MEFKSQSGRNNTCLLNSIHFRIAPPQKGTGVTDRDRAVACQSYNGDIKNIYKMIT